MLSLYPQVKWDLLNVQAPSVLIKSHKFPRPFPQYVCIPNHYDYLRKQKTKKKPHPLPPLGRWI